MTPREAVANFLAAGPYAVVGASRDRAKFGNKVLRCYVQHGLRVHPVHPSEREIEGLACAKDLASLPERVRSLSIVTPPPITEKIVEQAAAAGITRLWMQPGAESPAALRRAAELGLTTIAGGPCLLVELGFADA